MPLPRLLFVYSLILTFCCTGEGAVVAVRDGGKKDSQGAKGIIQTLQQAGTHRVKVIPKISAENLSGVDVLIVSHKLVADDRRIIRKFVRQGGGVFLTYDAAGSGRSVEPLAESAFPEIAKSETPGWNYVPTTYTNATVRPIRKHPINQGMTEKGFRYSFWDYVILCPVDDRTVLMEDADLTDRFSKHRFRGTQVRWNCFIGKNAVVIAAPFGKGRVVLSALMLGYDRNRKTKAVTGAEKTLLLNSVEWLKGDLPLGVPKAIQPSAPSRYTYTRQLRRKSSGKQSIAVETRLVRPTRFGDREPWVRFRLQRSAVGRSSPMVMEAPGYIPRSAQILRGAGKAGALIPVQVEKQASGQKQLVFVGSFSGRAGTLAFGAEAASQKGIKVRVSKDATLAEINGPHFSLLVGFDGDEPSIECARIHDWDWHPTWRGFERNNLSAPILRLAKSRWPFKATPSNVDHEVGHPFPIVKGEAVRTKAFPVRVTLRVGHGRLTVYRTGQIYLENFGRAGRIATFLVDRYVSDGKNVAETVSYDQPSVTGPWVWAQRDHRYAIGGTFHVQAKMGETGLAPGLERVVSLTGKTLVLTTDVTNLQRYQLPAVPLVVKPRKVRPRNSTIDSPPKTLIHPTIKVFQRRLWKMRGTDRFFPILAQPVEIYGDLLGKTPQVAKWRIDGDSNVRISPTINGPFANVIQDQRLIEGLKRTDPKREDAQVWRRVYLRCRQINNMKTTSLKLTGINESGETVVVVPVELHQAISMPLGIFTYGPMWSQFWHWSRKRKIARFKGRCPPETWASVLRNVARSGLDYIIHYVHEEEPERPSVVQNRLERYGMWWMVGMGNAYRKANNLAKPDNASKQRVEQFYAKYVSRWKNAPNIIAWYLSDELAHGEFKDGELPGNYKTASLLYDLCKKYDPQKRPAINLITPTATSYTTSTSHLRSDAFSWDPYGRGANGAYRAADIVNKTWRKNKSKPSWITLRCCGPGWYDLQDLWLDIRRRSLAAVRGNVDSINYFTYSNWATDMELNQWYAVIPGTKGAISTPRWQALHQVVRDVDQIITAEYLVSRMDGSQKAMLTKQLDQAKMVGQQGHFYAMRAQLKGIIAKANVTRRSKSNPQR